MLLTYNRFPFLFSLLFLVTVINKRRSSFDPILFRLFLYNVHISFVSSTEHVIHQLSALTGASASYANHTLATRLSVSAFFRIPSVLFTARPFKRLSKIIVTRKTNNKNITWLVYGKVSNERLGCRGKLTGGGTAHANPTDLFLFQTKKMSFNSQENSVGIKERCLMSRNLTK